MFFLPLLVYSWYEYSVLLLSSVTAMANKMVFVGIHFVATMIAGVVVFSMSFDPHQATCPLSRASEKNGA